MIALLLVLLAIAPIVAGAIITSSTVRTRAVNGLAFKPLKTGSGPQPRAHSSSNGNLPPGNGALVAIVKHTTSMRAAPAGRTVSKLPTRTGFGSPQVLLVTEVRGAWLGVLSPIVGNGHTGWIARSATKLGRVSWELRVSLRSRRLTVMYGGKSLRHYSVAVGRPGAPTPSGRFAVTDRLNTGDPSGPYGCCILALSAKSPHAIQGWSGGDRIAIHSTPETSSIGLAVSHGCVRVTLADGQWLLAHIPLGTPTVISG